MLQVLRGFEESVQQAMQNPFGLDFEVQGRNIYVTLGSALNCLGYNDHLERVIGVSRTALSLFVLVMSENKKQKLIAVGQILRGVMEMKGKFEHYLLALDIIFTIYNIGHKVLFKKDPNAPR